MFKCIEDNKSANKMSDLVLNKKQHNIANIV